MSVIRLRISPDYAAALCPVVIVDINTTHKRQGRRQANALALTGFQIHRTVSQAHDSTVVGPA